MRQLFIIYIVLSSISNASSQIILNRDTTIKVIENGFIFKSPFVGGINSAQFSEIDLNLDGSMDLVIFDKSGNKIIPFLSINGSYTYAPIYRDFFPKIHDWIILADYNCDGKNDIYTYSSGGMAIYENISDTILKFSLITSLVFSDYGQNNINIYVSPVDIPAISDIDNDGDLDILTFYITGGFVEYHRNMSKELTNSCDTIAFRREENCWGLFYEGLNTYTLNCLNCQCPAITNNSNSKEKHAGSTLLAIDIDNDNDKDLILGDISYNNLNLLTNGGDYDSAHVISIDSLFPQNNTNTMPINIDMYPASYYLDVTHDGIKDLIVTTNTENNSANFESCWLYENTGQNNNPDFNFTQKNFIQEEMLDFGKGSYPVFYDYNNDSLTDLVIGNYGYHNPNNDPTSSLALLKNIGTNNIPEYELINRDWLGISSINLNTNLNIPVLNLSPAFGDLDGDNNKDLIVGDADGKIHFFKNMNNGTFQIIAPNYYNIDVGYFAHPQIIDVNRDGLNDLIIGEQDGTINYCPNTGSINNAVFDTIIQNFGGIDVDQGIISSGHSSPKLIDSNGVYQLFVGSYSGNIYQFTNIDNNLNGIFTNVNSSMSNIWDGGRCVFTMKDITNDGQPDMFIGNISGGISYFSSDSIPTQTWNCISNQCVDPGDGSGNFTLLNICQNNCITNELISIENNDIIVFPNPTNNIVNITKTSDQIKIQDIKINNILGENMNNKITQYNNKDKKILDLSSYPRGVYIIKIDYNNKTTYKKIILE